MANFNFNSNRIAELEKKLEDYKVADAESDHEEDTRKVFLDILKDACSLVREADGFAPDFQNILDKVDGLINNAVDYAYGDGDLYGFMPSFAHSDANPELEGDIFHEEGVFSHGELHMFLPLLNIMMGKNPRDKFVPEPGRPVPKAPVPWPKSMKPHPLTSRLARFKGDIAVSASSDDLLANNIYEARCEINSTSIALPIGLHLSSSGTVLLLHGMGGWKNRDPVLRYFFPDDPSDMFPDEHPVKSGLSDIAYWTATDEERRLIFAADSSRIKSYVWAPASGPNYSRAQPTHTMDTGEYEGPLAVLSGGRLIRAGQGAVGVWNLDGLPTHGDKGKTRLGGVFNSEDSWRDDSESIESSSGSPADTVIKLEDTSMYPGVWAAHPSKKGAMICAADPKKTNGYSMVAVDLEGGGKSMGRYIGHGAELSAGGITVSASPEGDKNVFLTSCMDGLARLYDVRHPLPVLSMDCGRRSEGCPAAVLIHPDGIPTVFTGAEAKEHIKMWDIRARAAVYELSTGNNAVVGMAWDSQHNSLYAATECRYMDRMGNSLEYRRAKVPADQRENHNHNHNHNQSQHDGDEDEDDEDRDEDEDVDDEDDDEDDDDYPQCWPKKAYHGEDFFGYMFDAGEHRILRYAFKENPDTSILPAYGNAHLDSRSSFW